MSTRKVLGRGLSALIPDGQGIVGSGIVGSAPALVTEVPIISSTSIPAANISAAVPAKRDYFHCAITDIRPNRQQPRRHFDDHVLDELAKSIREVGIIQPIVVRQDANGYVIIAGERRWRAAQRAGLSRVPVVVREVSDLESLELALVENLQRADLNALEEAEAYQRLIDDHGYTQQQVAERLGRDRSTITNALRLLALPDPLQRAIIEGTLSAGHARALLGLEQAALMIDLFPQIISQKLSVRQTEALVKRLRTKQPKIVSIAAASPNVRDLENRLNQALKTRVALKSGKDNRGRIEIHYGSLDELDRLLNILLP